MTTQSSTKFKQGDRVTIRNSNMIGRVIELRGPLGPKGEQIYRILLRRKPRAAFVEVREDQLELVPATQSSDPASPADTSIPTQP